jgi:hypothetical protein
MWDFWTKWQWDRFLSEFFVSPVNIISSWLSILMYLLRDEQKGPVEAAAQGHRLTALKRTTTAT